MAANVTRLYPRLEERVPLNGLYLRQALRDRSNPRGAFVYTDFIVSMDGRIAIAGRAGRHEIPRTLTNPRDWRLYQELAAQADVLITSSRYIRQLADKTAQDVLPLSNDPLYADLHEWRRRQGLSPQPAVVIVSGGDEMPLADVREQLGRPVYVAVSNDVAPRLRPALASLDIKLIAAGQGRQVDGRELIKQLVAEGYSTVYSIAGPRVFNTLLRAGVLDRLYITRMHRLLGGESYRTLLEENLAASVDLVMRELYYDTHAADNVGQMLGVYDVVKGHR